ncbi:acyl carrier protein [Sporofaciens sp. JLR.KK001]|uniref:acyl carrier protein n=1 Tax=Sporofaciens sp. JLR.KK001 TaxID=3112621 RepID=UPI002FF22ACB
MNREEIFEKLTEVFADVFDDEDLEISETITSDDVEGWDSLAHINLIGSIEDEFGIKFAMEDLKNLESVSKIIDRIQELIK